MNQNIDMQMEKVRDVLKNNGFSISSIELLQQNSRVTDYLIDQNRTFRVSNRTLDELVKQDRVKHITFVPKIHLTGEFDVLGEKYYYLMMDYVQGKDLWSVVTELTDEQKIAIGKEIANFLGELHEISGETYDIGHYIPTIANCKKSWKDGHIEYVELLQKQVHELDLEPKSRDVAAKAFRYIYENIDCLDYQNGAKLLHNDLHPKNIIISDGKLAGIIDWECSQFGEADFELSHLFHWCIYPAIPENDIGILLKSVIENLPPNLKVPNMEKRLTIYQLEHDLNQLVWHGKKQEEERLFRINGWIDGLIYKLFDKWKLQSVT